MKRPFLIGLTGGIGVGKSTVAKLFAEHGAQIVSGDELGHRALEESPENLVEIRLRFGEEMFDADGYLLRRKFGRRVFASLDDAHWLTQLTGAGIFELWNQVVKQSRAQVLVLDAALIFEWRIEQHFDLVLLVTAPKSVVMARISKSRRLNEEEWEARRRTQLPESVKREKADVVIVNNGDLKRLRARTERVWQREIEPRLQKGIL